MITPSQIRAARSFLNLDQSVIAKAVGVSKANISEIENEKVMPKGATLAAIQKFFEIRGVEFKDGGITPAYKIVQIIEGNDAYLQLLDDVARNLGPKKELLKFGADERKSPPAVTEKNRELRKAGITMRYLVESGNTHLLGQLHEYRYIPAELFNKADIKLIYGTRVAYLMSWTNVPKVILIDDKFIAEEQTRMFEYIWRHAEPATVSTSDIRYEDI
jgi:transcriptional regulator with XRE-family HTH domain